ncbi:MarR family transcriptional regulator [Moorella naiadis]|uniref:MarR family winged helix-turn-helix transcriptional regulator n=1 Tax=Moorella naiadis (nom. illeg.) TaxID=3093670 RepID=UPI003D9C7D4B
MLLFFRYYFEVVLYGFKAGGGIARDPAFGALQPGVPAAGAVVPGGRVFRHGTLVLWKVHNWGPLRVKDLAGHIGIPPSTFTGVLDRLVARGLLERVPDPKDRRSVLVRGSPALAELIGRLTAAIEGELKHIFNALPEDCSRRLLADLQALSQYMEREKGESIGRT